MLWLGLGGLLALACQQNEKCEQSRLALTRKWETLRNTAASRKHVAEDSELNEQQKSQRLDQWSKIEDKAELMRSSFETQQVTWDAADKSRRELENLYKTANDPNDPLMQGFGVLLTSADKEYDEYRTQCK
jgi:pectin methylesterase-like acyl-CoA thioesterase